MKNFLDNFLIFLFFPSVIHYSNYANYGIIWNAV